MALMQRFTSAGRWLPERTGIAIISSAIFECVFGGS